MQEFDKVENKRMFMELAKENVSRSGIDNLLDWLEHSTDFFTAPCSTKYHLSVEGGLCQHSLNVYSALIDLCEAFNIPIIENIETITIISLFHDVCKANFYRQKYFRQRQPDGRYADVKGYEVYDQCPLGHGEKSTLLIQIFMHLTIDEMLAIRWHMGAYDEAIKGGSLAMNTAQDMSKFVTLLQCADLLAARLMEA